jgi:hypothetical protein
MLFRTHLVKTSRIFNTWYKFLIKRTDEDIMGLNQLPPLSKEMIDELQLDPHDLWVVKIEDQIFGPFEGQKLKVFAEKNEELFDKAHATRIENHDWQPFFTHALFQRRSPKIIKNVAENFEGPYWIINHGIKAGPIEKSELLKRIEIGALNLTDTVSIDDGHHWMKIFDIPDIDRRVTGEDLPLSPGENLFHEARIQLLEKLEVNSNLIRMSEQFAEITHEASGSGQKFIKEIPIKREEASHLDKALKIKLAGSFFALLFLALGIPYLLQISTSSQSASVETDPQEGDEISQEAPSMREIRSKVHRTPASSKPKPKKERPRFKKSSREMEEVAQHTPIYRDDLPVEQNPPFEAGDNEMANSVNGAEEVSEYQDENTDEENRSPSSEEDSLVPKSKRKDRDSSEGESELSVEDVMNGVEAPAVEEASDF